MFFGETERRDSSPGLRIRQDNELDDTEARMKRDTSRSRRRRDQAKRKRRDRTDQHWMSKLAYSFRSTSSRTRHKGTLQRIRSRSEYDGQMNEKDALIPRDVETYSDLHSPHMGNESLHDFISIAATFLMDYEASRSPCFARHNLSEISRQQLLVYQIKNNSGLYRMLLRLSAVFLFLSSAFEGINNSHMDKMILSSLNAYSVVVLAVDLYFEDVLSLKTSMRTGNRRVYDPRSAQNSLHNFTYPLILFCSLLFLENLARLLITPTQGMILFTSGYKPLVLFFLSTKARSSFAVLQRATEDIGSAVAMNLFLIFVFAVISCHVLVKVDTFSTLSSSVLTLLEMSTVYADPKTWRAVYFSQKPSVLLFGSFMILCVLFFNAMILGILFKTCRIVSIEDGERAEKQRDQAVRLCYVALLQHQAQLKVSGDDGSVNICFIRDVMKAVRPHYSAMKVTALVDIVSPGENLYIDFASFRINIRHALNASLRTARSATPVALLTELVAVIVAVANCTYAVAVTTAVPDDVTIVWVGAGIACLAAVELLLRFNPFRLRDLLPLTRFDATFDGIALVAAIISLVGIGLFRFGFEGSKQVVVIGRAVDLVRIIRFFQVFRDIVFKLRNVVPDLGGPVVVALSSLHVFVYCGIALWARNSEDDVPTSLPGFSSYHDGAIIMFHVFLHDDWNDLTERFLTSSRFNNPVIVYGFFGTASIVGGIILANLVVAYFVNSWDKETDDPKRSTQSPLVTTLGNPVLPRVGDDGADSDSDESSIDLYQFDVFEREDQTKIMGPGSDLFKRRHFCEHICQYFEVFQNIAPSSTRVGWLVFDSRDSERFCNRIFEAQSAEFLDAAELHATLDHMQAEMVMLSSRATASFRKPISRHFQHASHANEQLTITASYLHRHSAVMLFVSQVHKKKR